MKPGFILIIFSVTLLTLTLRYDNIDIKLILTWNISALLQLQGLLIPFLLLREQQ